jgi:heme-degrading monooxygenase HmoA
VADPLLLVTTRSRLRSVRFLPLVLAANRRIRRQLASTDGIVRFASLVAGPTEVWSVTVWRSRHAMQEFMRSGEHGRVLWQIGEVLSSFWLLRSRFSSHQIGTWDGMVMPVAPRCTTTPAPAEAALTDEVLAGIPLLREAAGRDGAASYDRSPPLSQERRRVEGAAGALVRVAGPPVRVLHARVALRCLADWLQADEDLLRVVAGFGRRDEVFLLALWRDRAGPDRLLGSPWVHEARKRWGDGLWVAGWLPEHEFGTWDGLRVRALGLHLQRESRPTPPPVSDRPVT